MQEAEFGDRMSNHIVNSALRNLPAVNMCNRDSGIHGRKAHCNRLITVSQHNQHINLILLEIRTKFFQCMGHCFTDRRCRILVVHNRYLNFNRHSVIKNLLTGIAEFCQQMCACDKQCQFQLRVFMNPLYYWLQQPIFGSRCCQDGNHFSIHLKPQSTHLLQNL